MKFGCKGKKKQEDSKTYKRCNVKMLKTVYKSRSGIQNTLSITIQKAQPGTLLSSNTLRNHQAHREAPSPRFLSFLR